MRIRGGKRSFLSLGIAALLLVGALASTCGHARAQDLPEVIARPDSIAPLPDSTATEQVYPPPEAPHERIRSHLVRTAEERDRFEIGAAIPTHYFDVLGTFGYRRFLREGGPFEQSMQLEASGTKKNYLTEGSIGAYYLLRPLKSYREEWKIRPLLEAGPAAHLTIQVADIVGFNDQSFHAHGFLKGHLYGGAEFLLSRKFGFLVRGRLTVPEHRPFDYAQAAILLR